MKASGTLRIAAAACILLVGIAAAVSGKTIYVDDDAAGAGNGSSWVHAFSGLQDALAAAVAGDEIHLAQGVYRPTPGAAFHLVGGAVLRGGYAGLGAPDPDVRHAELYRTILSADLKGDDAEVQHPYDLADEPTRAENSASIIQIGEARAMVFLDGFTLTGAARSAIKSERASVTITDCIFTQNVTGENGGAVYSRGGDLTLARCAFAANWASDRGGAVYTDAGCRVTATECRFTNNQAGAGGAVACLYADVRMTGCTFERNAARTQGAVQCTAGMLLASDCTFSGNSAALRRSAPVPNSFPPGDGGALGLLNTRGGGCEATVIGCRFEGNRAGIGGAISGCGPSTLRECLFVGNRADEGGAISGPYGSTIRNCVFAGNRAQTGGAVELSGSVSSQSGFVNCTFCANRAESGKAIAREPRSSLQFMSPVALTNCIVWDGTPEFGTPAEGQTVKTEITFSDVLGGWGAGNINVDPCLADPGYWDPNGTPNEPADDFWVSGDYHLKSQAGRWDPATRSWVRDAVTSLCVDGGDPNAPLGAELFPHGGFVNIGAYGGTAEASKSWFGGPVCERQIAGDINGDCRVDQTDMDILTRHWLERMDFPPTVAVTVPADEAEIAYPTPIVFEVDASDSDGTIRWIEFTVEDYTGGGHGRTRASGPADAGTTHREYRWDWSRVHADGLCVAWAAVTDNDGNRTVSERIRVTLHPAK
jgi:predicted outer membrane repeat protein